LQNSRYYEQEEREIMDRFENMMGVSFDMNQMAYVPRTEDIDVSVADTEVKK
jgi:hypothetical protein